MPEQRAISQTTERFDALFAVHHQAVARYCIRRLGLADGEDAAAEVFAVAWRRLDEIPAEATRIWLIAVAFRVVGNHYRTRRRRALLSSRVAEDARIGEARQAETSDSVTLQRALASLSAADRDLLQMTAWDGLTRQEIAAVLHIKENAVDQRLFRARHRLKERFERMRIEGLHTEPREIST